MNAPAARSAARAAVASASRLRAHSVYLAAGLAAIGVYFALPERPQLVAYQLFAVSALLAVAAGIRRHRPPRVLPWLLVAAYLGAHVAADCVWNVYELGLGRGVPFPSAADALYLCGYLCLTAAALLFARGAPGVRSWTVLLEAGVVAAGAALPLWVLLVEPMASGGASTLAQATTLAYPLMDIVTLCAFVRLSLVPGGQGRSRLLLMLGIAALLAADVTYLELILHGRYAGGSVVDAGWQVAYLLTGAAALHPGMRSFTASVDVQPRLTARRLMLLTSAALVVPVVLALNEEPDDLPMVVVAAVMTLLVVARLGLEHRRFDAFAAEVAGRRALEEQLRRAQKMEALGRLAGGVAHDFNNLLTAISGYAELLASELPRGTPAARDVDEIRRAGDRAAALARQLLVFSRRQRPAPVPVDLNALVSQTEQMLRRLLGEHVQLVTVLGAERPVVLADPGELEQVLVNLAVNARDAMDGSGTLTVETRQAPAGEVVLRVRDTGAGIDPDLVDRIFEPFFATKPKEHGTGLGLSTAYAIVSEAGGTISVESAPGAGACFEVTLPRCTAPSGEHALPARREPHRARAATILLVEDEPAVRAFVTEALRRHGHEVVAAADGEQALALAGQRAEPPDLLLSDVVMPRLDGPELARRLRARWPQLPVLLVSGYIEERLDDRQLAAIGAEFLEKPFGPEVLCERVAALLDPAAPLDAARA